MDEEQILARLADLERKLDWLHRNADYPSPSPDTDDSAPAATPDVAPARGQASSVVLDLVHRGAKIEAIKQYREETGVGLKEAKDFVDSLG